MAESGGVSKAAVAQVKESLQLAKTRILGLILNKIAESPGTYYNYYTYYKRYAEPEEVEASSTAVSWFKGGLGSVHKSMGGRSR